MLHREEELAVTVLWQLETHQQALAVMWADHAGDGVQVVGENEDGVVLMLDALLVDLWRGDKVDAAVLPPHIWNQKVWEIRNRFGIRYFPY